MFKGRTAPNYLVILLISIASFLEYEGMNALNHGYSKSQPNIDVADELNAILQSSSVYRLDFKNGFRYKWNALLSLALLSGDFCASA